MKRSLIASSAAALAAVLASACSSGSVGVTPPPPPHRVTLTTQQQAAQADAGMAGTNGIRAASLLLALLALATSADAQAATIPCKDGIETKVTKPSPTSIVAIVNVYYDPACTQPLIKSKTRASLGAPTQLAGAQTTYDPSGRPVAFGKIIGTGTLGISTSTASLRGTIARTRSGKAIASFGISCTFGFDGNSCGFGAVNSGLSKIADLGITSSLAGFVASGPGSGTIDAVAFAGSPGSLQLKQGTGNVWIVTGGKRVGAQHGTFDENVNAKQFTVRLDVALTDAAGDANSAIRLRRQGMSGSVVQRSNGLLAATFGTAPLGTGVIHYSDGSTGAIAFFVVI